MDLVQSLYRALPLINKPQNSAEPSSCVDLCHARIRQHLSDLFATALSFLTRFRGNCNRPIRNTLDPNKGSLEKARNRSVDVSFNEAEKGQPWLASDSRGTPAGF